MRPGDDRNGSRRAISTDGHSGQAWTKRSRIVLTPMAAPSILGLFGFAGATFMVASLLAGRYPAGLPSARVGQ